MSILLSLPLVNPVMPNSNVLILVLAPDPNSWSSFVSSIVWIKTAGYCCCDNSSNSNGCLVTFFTSGLDILPITVTKLDAMI